MIIGEGMGGEGNEICFSTWGLYCEGVEGMFITFMILAAWDSSGVISDCRTIGIGEGTCFIFSI